MQTMNPELLLLKQLSSIMNIESQQRKALLQIMKQGLRLPKQSWLITRRELLPMNLS
ncbi:Uncharacterised protein [Klebsiella pneumoniae subsp. ozaenae]|uniref:Uncharacterized protein n=1 Tax=Klebsiella pneumoniae subsp. ozaenae TaxID=574 RepID=A0A377ZQE7_KLEPO|nr:Uncharacterised protein [Klebsiella pneumoniae subsp. ozaenae]